MARWGMVIDLRNCIGCNSCTVACGEANRLPHPLWRKVVDCGVSGSPQRQRALVPFSCMHCREATCLKVCPNKATFRRSDGTVDIDYERCIGCGYCVVACPYRARTICHREFALETPVNESGVAGSDPGRDGVCTKCNFCHVRIEAGLKQGLAPGYDAEATPACVNSCSSGALHFGDLDDPDSEVSRLIRENRTTRIMEGLGTDPSVYYIVPEGWEKVDWKRGGNR